MSQDDDDNFDWETYIQNNINSLHKKFNEFLSSLEDGEVDEFLIWAHGNASDLQEVIGNEQTVRLKRINKND